MAQDRAQPPSSAAMTSSRRRGTTELRPPATAQVIHRRVRVEPRMDFCKADSRSPNTRPPLRSRRMALRWRQPGRRPPPGRCATSDITGQGGPSSNSTALTAARARRRRTSAAIKPPLLLLPGQGQGLRLRNNVLAQCFRGQESPPPSGRLNSEQSVLRDSRALYT